MTSNWEYIQESNSCTKIADKTFISGTSTIGKNVYSVFSIDPNDTKPVSVKFIVGSKSFSRSISWRLDSGGNPLRECRFDKDLISELLGSNPQPETKIVTFKRTNGSENIIELSVEEKLSPSGNISTTKPVNNNQSSRQVELIDEKLKLSDNFPRNIILFGPPGTGKTYNTINYAVAIIEKKSIEDIQKESFAVVKERYDNYKARKLIDFVTFHQSYGYEDFIEGIKPIVSSTGQITYEIVPGIFKKFCEYATPENVQEFPSEFRIWKVSLKADRDPDFWNDCISNGCIRIGYEDNSSENSNRDKRIVSRFKSEIQVGDYVIGMNSQQLNVAVGRVTSDYEYRNDFDYFKHYRKVDWIGFYDKKKFIDNINNGTGFTLATVYSLNKIREKLPLLLDNLSKDKAQVQTQSSINPEALSNKINKYQTDVALPHVFIIDEINRGNVSKIFGELITAIEGTKRIGEVEELQVTLPYSKEEFGVPSNIYILGTMNTADRSLARIDTALRRRFTFKELMPKTELLAEIPDIEGINIKKMLDVINERIEFLLSREHSIGHAYFLQLKTSPDFETLRKIFQNKIIPLLQEYFYEDYLKIQLILGDSPDNTETNFIMRLELRDNLFRTDVPDAADARYIFNEDAFTNPESYRKIYE